MDRDPTTSVLYATYTCAKVHHKMTFATREAPAQFESC